MADSGGHPSAQHPAVAKPSSSDGVVPMEIGDAVGPTPTPAHPHHPTLVIKNPSSGASARAPSPAAATKPVLLLKKPATTIAAAAEGGEPHGNGGSHHHPHPTPKLVIKPTSGTTPAAAPAMLAAPSPFTGSGPKLTISSGGGGSAPVLKVKPLGGDNSSTATAHPVVLKKTSPSASSPCLGAQLPAPAPPLLAIGGGGWAGATTAASNEEEEEDDDDDDDALAMMETDELPSAGEEQNGLEEVDLKEEGAIEAYTEVRQEQLKQIEEAKQKAKLSMEGGGAAAGSTGDKGQRKLEYLMAQSEMFAHFLGAQSFQKKSGKKKGSVKMSMEEKDEDAALMKTATSNQRVTRLLYQPKSIINGVMRPYQLEGLNWMIKLHDNGINGILADEMGLGKTLQTISLLAYLREARNMQGPHIVIVPKSTVGNWMKEFGRWCPSIKAVKLLGTKEERADMVRNYLHSKGAQRPFNVVITSYEGVLKERAALEKIQWRYVIIDEAHRIKNEKSALSKMVRMFKSHFRLLITGTPLQNDLHELWALLNYIMPDVFDSSDTFDEWFNLGGGGQSENVIRKLHQVLKPFMLRRVKAEVEKDLPPKKETKLFIGMTDMQREWYRRILRRDGASLNMLGGAGDRLRLLNILMQLRKVCNHPYLFEGAEPGPPYIDGPHIWENCGKMMLLNKLLPKLQIKDSRVLIFCQMTRQLDILEDYLRLQRYKYCRIDGSTKGDERDDAVERFNKPGSDIFCFLLSTRAGGLGINLATADTVILYDSDWNPQVDLQAMDRAHRIGQTKQVRVFRFITEGTVEEKIIERADRKLFLDAAVIQQGRLAEKHNSVSKDELLTMVKFGADEILNAAGTGFTDEDIDMILQKGEAKTMEQNEKYQKNIQHNLAKFTLLDDQEERNLFEFEGEDFKNKRKDGIVFDMGHCERRANQNYDFDGIVFDIGQRERRANQNYDVDAYYRMALKGTSDSRERGPPIKRGRKLVLPEHQFFHRPRLQELHDKETKLITKRQEIWGFIKDLRAGRKAAVLQIQEGTGTPEEVADRMEKDINDGRYELSPIEQEERRLLMEQGFKDWSRKDLRALVNATERWGRDDKTNIIREIVAETAKEEVDVLKYYDVFWERYMELPNWRSIDDKIRKGEQRIARNKEIREALDAKVSRHKNPWQSLTINYGPQSKQQRMFSDEEDIFLVVLMHKFEYGNWERIRMEIRKSEKFNFDWFFKSRTSAELAKRGDALIKLIEKENAQYDRLYGGGGSKNKRRRDDDDDSVASETASRSTNRRSESKSAAAKKRKSSGYY